MGYISFRFALFMLILWHKNIINVMKTTEALFVSGGDVGMEIHRENFWLSCRIMRMQDGIRT